MFDNVDAVVAAAIAEHAAAVGRADRLAPLIAGPRRSVRPRGRLAAAAAAARRAGARLVATAAQPWVAVRPRPSAAR